MALLLFLFDYTVKPPPHHGCSGVAAVQSKWGKLLFTIRTLLQAINRVKIIFQPRTLAALKLVARLVPTLPALIAIALSGWSRVLAKTCFVW